MAPVLIVDSAVLVYAAGSEHPLRQPARGVIAAIGQGRLEATTTVEVMQEFVHVRSRRRPRSDAVALAREHVAAFAPLVAPDEADLMAALEIFLGHERVGAFDAVLAASAIRRGLALVSGDRGFADIADLHFLLLGSPELGAVLTV